jgi:hypothetical protein
MKVKALLTLTGIVSSILGATVVYLMLSVPNDLRADALLKTAHQQLEKGKEQEARASLSKVVQQYPRTDAAAAATVALATLGQKDRDALRRDMLAIRKQNEQLTSLVMTLQKSVTEVKNAPPKVVTVEVPAPKPKPKPAPPKKKAPARRRR